MPKKEPDTESPLTTDDKLDLIVMYLHRMDRRDRMRMLGSMIHTLITLTYLGIFFWSIWYFASHGDALLKQITDMSVKSAASMTQNGLMDQFNEYIGKPKQ